MHETDKKITAFLEQIHSLSNTSPSEEQIKSILKAQYWCSSRDIFGAKLANFDNLTNNPLLTAICGEIGNNAFDHNLGKWTDIPGLYFNHDLPQTVILLDRGQGVYKSLKKVRPQISSDTEALQMAFTEHVSGREPECRGNGLKFVADAISQNNWYLFFQSGDCACIIKNGQMEICIANNNHHCFSGCLAVIKY